MANLCYFKMAIRGEKDKVDNFCSYIQNRYYYGPDYKYSGPEKHLFRVDPYSINIEDRWDHSDSTLLILDGSCAWSAMHCMLPGGYYSQWKKTIPEDQFHGTNLIELSKEDGLIFEVFSEEGGCCFQEYFLISNGELEAEETVDWNEYCLDDFSDKETAETELEIKITEDEWNNKECKNWISRGGFGEWEFSI